MTFQEDQVNQVSSNTLIRKGYYLGTKSYWASDILHPLHRGFSVLV